MADLKISQLPTTTDPNAALVPLARGGANNKLDVGAAIDAKISAALAGDVAVGALLTDDIQTAAGVPLAHVDTGELIFDVPVKFDRVRLIPTTTLPTVEGTYIYHDIWKCMVGFNGTKVIGFTEWANYVASAASNQSGVGSDTVITNNALGADSRSKLRYFTSLYDPSTSKIFPSSTPGLDDVMFIKFGFDIVTTSPNTKVSIKLQAYDASDTPLFYESLYDNTIAAAGTTKFDRFSEIYFGPSLTTASYFKLLYTSDASISLNNKAWRPRYVHI